LRFVDPTPSPGWLRRWFCALAATRLALFISRHVSWHLDPVLLKLTRGRFCSTLMIPTEVLQTRGARTGATRTNAVIYFHDVAHDGDRVIIAASNAGSPRHPDWYHNLVKNPDVTFGGVSMRAALVAAPERERLWRLADRVFPAYATYRRRAAAAGRELPLVQLTPRTNEATLPRGSKT
jgi:deazaflavin-dependent oxidoreductase (nitroreductase family)